jgi:pimeloyl-ACP methyl ester carboxylesterase/glycine cleavage system regulatory protein
MVGAYRPTPMALPEFSAVTDRALDDRLHWFHLTVDGRRAVGAVGGDRDGPPVVFLHGWALGSRTYKRGISRLIARGCRVYAPALPSFGGTRDLPPGRSDLDGYGRWVAEFMAEVGIDEPAMLIGHSLGGGVAMKLAEMRPELVSYLVLLNAVGGVSGRSPWARLATLGRELWPPTTTIELARAVQSDLIPNLVGNPLGLVRAGVVAWRADLRAEAEKVRSAGIPVLVLTGNTDAVVPRQAFESLCDAIGTEGRVVDGGHSWMLADPDSLAAAMGPVIDRHVAEHRTSRAATRVGTLAELLRRSEIPRPFVNELLAGAPPLWLLSESVPVLATDLAMCYPAPGPDEVRAMARRIDQSDAIRLTVVTKDRKGLLADSGAVLAASGLSITHASAATWTRRKIALQSFVIEDGQQIGEAGWDEVGRNLQVMAATRSLPPQVPVRPSRIIVHGGDKGQMLVTVTVRDEIGALSGVCRVFSDHDISIESLHARSVGGSAHDTFLLSGVDDDVSVAALFESAVRGGPPSYRTPGPSARRRGSEPPPLASVR